MRQDSPGVGLTNCWLILLELMPLPSMDVSLKVKRPTSSSQTLYCTMWLMRSHFMAQLLKFIHIQMNGWNEQRMLQVITRYKYLSNNIPITWSRNCFLLWWLWRSFSQTSSSSYYYQYCLLTYISSSSSSDVWPRRSHFGWNECFVWEVKPFVASNAIKRIPIITNTFTYIQMLRIINSVHVSFRRMFR